MSANRLTIWAEVVFDALAAAGVRDVVVSPGSRSTPFVLAAARHPSLRCHAVLDERAAAFYALGLARVSSRAPLLVCTSGSAPAHYLPAIVEASECALPLLVLSADRPASLSACGAPQTTDQQRLYGVHTRFFADLGAPEGSEAALRGLRRLVARAVSEAHGPAPGPVHLDARAEKPLEPRAPSAPEDHALASLASRLRAEPLVRVPVPRMLASDESIGLIASALARAERPAIVAGPIGLEHAGACDALLRLARARGLALFAEAPSQLRFTGSRDRVLCADAFDRWIEHAPPEARPDVVLEVGATPTSASYARWLERGGPGARFVAGGSRFRDPSGRADAVVLGELGPLVSALHDRLAPRAVDPPFAEALLAQERRAWGAVERALAEEGLHEGAIARMLAAALPEGALLALGNSLPIRHADRFVPGGRPLRLLAQRGVNGIDGAVAGVVGAAVADGGPVALLAGDVTLAHDVGALALAARVTTPLALVVIDNGGGRIFEQLPVGHAALSEEELGLFLTPPAIDLEAAARAFGVGYAHAAEPAAFARALELAMSRPGATLIRAEVPPRGAAALEARIAVLMEIVS